MKRTTRILAAAAAVAAIAAAGAVAAHPGGWGMGPGMHGMGPGWGMGPGMHGMGPGMGPGAGMGWGMGPGMGGAGFDMTAAAAGQLAALKAQLKITPAQEGAWKAYEEVVTKNAGAMQAMRDQFHAQSQNVQPGAAPPDVAAHHQAMTALRESSWKAQNEARQQLYSALTPEQRALADRGFGPGAGRRPGPR